VFENGPFLSISIVKFIDWAKKMSAKKLLTKNYGKKVQKSEKLII
jgi:hypothetical protein